MFVLGFKSFQSYNGIMKMDSLPARIQICPSPGQETENFFGVALECLNLLQAVAK